VSSGTVAAFLTILGYSIYDTIIVFDRIRENVPRMPRATFSQIVNRSMSDVLTRSLAAGFTTLLGVTSLMIFGGAVLQDFAFAMLVGIASGTYSSIFIASPVLCAWKEREPGFIRRRMQIAEGEGGQVPAYADEIEMAKLGRDDEPEAAAAPVAEEPAAEAAPGAIATVERTDDSGNGSGSLTNGDSDGDDDSGSAERRQRNAERRARRQARRKHGRKR
jgi:SecD/SecF fusion protein